MSAQTFAAFARTAPNPSTVDHGVGGPINYTCHMAVMHWAFMELGDNQATANAKVSAIATAKCSGCTPADSGMHGSIDPGWYGAHFCAGAPVAINGRANLYANVNVGDVMILPSTLMPMHSMVVVRKKSNLIGHYVYVRGLNNVGTLGTGPYLAYDNADRDIDSRKHWRIVAGNEVFGNGGADLQCVPYATYIANAAIVRNNCNNAGGNWVYAGL